MSKRENIKIEALSYGDTPIPVAIKKDNIVITSRIRGRDPETGKIAETIDKEVDLIFGYLKEILSEAGATLDDVAFMRMFVNDEAAEQEFNAEWVRMFPDPNDRPVRYPMYMDDGRPMAGGAHVMGEFVAVLG